jgi:hypothetical protein
MDQTPCLGATCDPLLRMCYERIWKERVRMAPIVYITIVLVSLLFAIMSLAGLVVKR